MPVRIDLQVHSTWSDGHKNVRQIAALLKKSGISITSLTDHNSVAGVEEMTAECKKLKIRNIPGTEIYTHYRKRTFHVLAYNINIHSPYLQRFLKRLYAKRLTEVRRAIAALKRQGFTIDLNNVAREKGEYISLVDFISALGKKKKNQIKIHKDMKTTHPKYFSTLWHYFGIGKPAELHETSAPLKTAIDTIRRAGGTAVLSHPGAQMGNEEGYLIGTIKKMGVRGIEVLSPYHNWRQIEHFQDMAYKHKLFMTMGSDYHGDLTSPYAKRTAVRDPMSYYNSPPEFISQLRKALHV